MNLCISRSQQSTQLVPADNVIISPLAVASSVALLTLVTNGTTYDEIRKGLHLNSNKSIIGDQFHELFAKIKKYDDSITTVNQIYVQEHCEINKTYQQIAKIDFAAGIEQLDFRQQNESAQTINHFVEKISNCTVRNIIMPETLNNETKMVLVDTIYFNNNWLYPFEKECTHRGDFYVSENETVQVEYMCIKDRSNRGPIVSYEYFNDLDATAVELYFGNTDFTLVIILPNDRTGLSDLEIKLKDYDLKSVMRRLGNEKPYLTIPKFEIEFDIELNGILKNVCLVGERMSAL